MRFDLSNLRGDIYGGLTAGVVVLASIAFAKQQMGDIGVSAARAESPPAA